MATPLAPPLGERTALDALRREAHPLSGDTWELGEPPETYPSAP